MKEHDPVPARRHADRLKRRTRLDVERYRLESRSILLRHQRQKKRFRAGSERLGRSWR